MKCMRDVMSKIHRLHLQYVADNAPEIVPFSGPHHGVHIRVWCQHAAITIECDPGYAGIGAGMTPAEAKGLGEALVRAAHIAFLYNEHVSPDPTPASA